MYNIRSCSWQTWYKCDFVCRKLLKGFTPSFPSYRNIFWWNLLSQTVETGKKAWIWQDACAIDREKKLHRTLVLVLKTVPSLKDSERFEKSQKKPKQILPAGSSITAPFESVYKQTSEARFSKQSNFSPGK